MTTQRDTSKASWSDGNWRHRAIGIGLAILGVGAVAVIVTLAVGFELGHLLDMALPVVFVVGIGVAAIVALALLLPRMASIRSKIATVSVITVLTVAGGVSAGAVLMFFSSHDLRVLIVVLAVASAVGAMIAVVASRSIARPLATIESGFDDLASGDLSARVAVTGRDESARLAAAFNGMADDVGALWEAERRNERANRTLIASISHDLRTPIASLRAMVEALADGVVDDEETRDRYLIQLRRQTDDLSELVNDLFEFNRLQAGDVEIDPAPTDLGEIVHSCVAQFSVQADAVDIVLRTDAPDSLPIVGGERALHRVLANLVQNALAHTPPGGRVEVAVASRDGNIDVSVRDDGPGIAPEHLEHVFEPFYRGDAARTRSSGRAGLGLAIADSLVAAHGGRIWAANNEAGAVVGFTIPDHVATARESEPDRRRRAGAR